MCDYDHARIGFVLFNEYFTRACPLYSLQTIVERDSIKSFLNESADPNGYTNISAGLEKAYELFEEAYSFNGERTPFVILLSDGNNVADKNIYPSKEERDKIALEYDNSTVEQANKLKEQNVSIYSIAFTADTRETTGDKTEYIKLLDTISGYIGKNGQSKGVTYPEHYIDENGQPVDENGGVSIPNPVKTEELPRILSDIMARQMRVSVKELDSYTANGEPKRVTIPIPNKSVYLANVIVLSGDETEIGTLFDPEGNNAVEGVDYIITSSKHYSLIKIFHPKMGDYTVDIQGKMGDEITINLINNYDLELIIDIPKEIKRGEKQEISAYFSDLDGNKLTDSDGDVLKDADGVLYVVEPDDEDASDQDLYEMTYNNNSEMSVLATFDDPGIYTLYAIVTGDDGNGGEFEKETEHVEVKVEPGVFKLAGGNDGTAKINMYVPILFFKLNTAQDLKLNKYIEWDNALDLVAEAEDGSWNEICKISGYNPDSRKITLSSDNSILISAIKGGESDIALSVKDGYRSHKPISVSVHVRVFPWVLSLVSFIVPLAVLIVLVFFGIRKWKSTRPKLVGKLGLKLKVFQGDEEIHAALPINIDFSKLTSDDRMGSKSLRYLIDKQGSYESTYQPQYLDWFEKNKEENVIKYLNNITVKTADRGKSVVVVLPKPVKNDSVYVGHDADDVYKQINSKAIPVKRNTKENIVISYRTNGSSKRNMIDITVNIPDDWNPNGDSIDGFGGAFSDGFGDGFGDESTYSEDYPIPSNNGFEIRENSIGYNDGYEGDNYTDSNSDDGFSI